MLSFNKVFSLVSLWANDLCVINALPKVGRIKALRPQILSTDCKLQKLWPQKQKTLGASAAREGDPESRAPSRRPEGGGSRQAQTGVPLTSMAIPGWGVKDQLIQPGAPGRTKRAFWEESKAGSRFRETVKPTEREPTVVGAFLGGLISGEGTQNQIWALWKDKVIAERGQQEVGRLAPATVRMEDLRATEKERNPERAAAVNWTDVARDNSATLTWELGQGRGRRGDPSLMPRGFN